MKTKFRRLLGALALLALSTLDVRFSTAIAQGTAFTYQGRLQNNGGPASGSFDLTFTLYPTNVTGSAIAGPVTNTAVAVTNGLFTTLVDFGPNAFTGASNWLEMAVRTNGGSGFSTLAPRQQVTPTPYAIYAENVSAAGISGTIPPASLGGTYGNPVTLSNAGNSFSGSYSGNGANVSNVNAVALNGLNATNFWQLGGNNVTAGQFLGSTNNQSLEIRVNGLRAGLISPSNGFPNIVFGTAQNIVSNTTAGASILGGDNNNIGTSSSYSMIGGGNQNVISNTADHSVLVGGNGNSIWSGANDSVLGGGSANSIQAGDDHSVLVGGINNSIQAGAYLSVLGGGQGNSIGSAAYYSFIGSGVGNVIFSGASYSVIGGGNANGIEANAYQSFIGGGNGDRIYSDHSVLGGGIDNQIQLSDGYSVLGGGEENIIWTGAGYSVLVGGQFNYLEAGATNSVIGGGFLNVIQAGSSFLGSGSQNTISNNAYQSVLGGGQQNSIQAGAFQSVLGGGASNAVQAPYSFLGSGNRNTISNSANDSVLGGGNQNSVAGSYATVPGGSNNVASGQNSFAAGANAQAINSGAFVWSDIEAAPFTSTNANSFNVRATGGARFVTGGAGLTVDGQPVLAGNISLTQLIAEVVTNNEPAVSLGSLTLGGNLNLPFPAGISSGGFPLLYADNNQTTYLGINAGSGGNNNTAIGNAAFF